MNSLPMPITEFIGRETEVAAARQLLLRDSVRLVTMTGPGGIGKSRLALHVVHAVSNTFPDGAYFISLASLSDPNLLSSAIAQALGLREAGAHTIAEVLSRYLRAKHVLLLLDNFEQILPAAPYLADLLEHCPQLKILVTSRAVLRLRGEYEFQVPPLAVPDLKQITAAKQLADYPAIALFIQRTHCVDPNLQFREDELEVIVKICARLDGLPLAIELATAWVKLLPPRDLLERLERGMEILKQGARDVPVRHQSLRHTLNWSYDLLEPREQQFFRRMGVFVGGCTLEAIEAITTELGEGAALDLIASLIDKSLLRSFKTGDGATRLMMLETIREYALELLSTHAEAQAIRRIHVQYYLRLAEQAQPNLTGAAQPARSDRLERDHDNLRAALRWACA